MDKRIQTQFWILIQLAIAIALVIAGERYIPLRKSNILLNDNISTPTGSLELALKNDHQRNRMNTAFSGAVIIASGILLLINMALAHQKSGVRRKLPNIALFALWTLVLYRYWVIYSI